MPQGQSQLILAACIVPVLQTRGPRPPESLLPGARVEQGLSPLAGVGSPPDVAHLGPVLQEPAVGCLVLPAHVAGVLPQQPHL